jgi:hypothetical protein
MYLFLLIIFCEQKKKNDLKKVVKSINGKNGMWMLKRLLYQIYSFPDAKPRKIVWHS